MGGIFFDYLDSGDFERDFAFTRDVGEAFLEIYPRLVRAPHERAVDRRPSASTSWCAAAAMSSSTCCYDRGTKFGLMTGGNVEAILMSLPPEVRWP